MRKYETLMVLNPELPEAQTRETIDRVKRLIEANGGRDTQVQEWGIRELAYPIRKFHRGCYVLAEYGGEPALVNELGRTLKIADEVLRFVTVAAPRIQPKPRTSTGATEPEQALEAEAE